MFPDDTVFIQGAAATPISLARAMAEHGRTAGLCNVTVCSMHTEGPAEYTAPDLDGVFRSHSFFMGGNVRKAVAEGRADVVPIFLQDIPRLFHDGIYKPDVSLISVSPPDQHGYCSLGTSVDCVRAALKHSKLIVAQINKQLPRTFGDAIIHQSHLDFATHVDEQLPSHATKAPKDYETKIGQLIAENLVADGATLQMGIGSIPDAVLLALQNHKDLGIHSEMFSDGVVRLVEKGCITNAKKVIHKGRIVASFLIGSKKLYDYVDNNPFIGEHINIAFRQKRNLTILFHVY